MASPSVRSMFRNFTYQKSIEDLVAAFERKIQAVKDKIAERTERIARIRKEYNITDQDLIDLLSQASQNHNSTMSYSFGGAEQRVIGAGVVQNILTERNLVEQEKVSVSSMEQIVRNLRPVHHVADNGTPWVQTHFELTADELEYLGF